MRNSHRKTPTNNPTTAASDVTLATCRNAPGLRVNSAVSNGTPNPIFGPNNSPDAASGVEISSKAIALGKKMSVKSLSDVKETLTSCVTRVSETKTRSGNQKE